MSGEAVKVIVRCRPMNERENKLNCKVGRIWVRFICITAVQDSLSPFLPLSPPLPLSPSRPSSLPLFSPPSLP